MQECGGVRLLAYISLPPRRETSNCHRRPRSPCTLFRPSWPPPPGAVLPFSPINPDERTRAPRIRRLPSRVGVGVGGGGGGGGSGLARAIAFVRPRCIAPSTLPTPGRSVIASLSPQHGQTPTFVRTEVFFFFFVLSLTPRRRRYGLSS